MIEIRTLKYAEEIDQLADLFALVFKVKITTETIARSWRWRYIQNPLAGSMPEITVALDGSKIVGARPFMLNELWLGNKKVIAAQHCDTMVHPDYRRQGIFNRMGQYSVDYLSEHGCALSYGFPGPMSRKGFASQGYRKLMDTEILFRFINPVEVMISKLKKYPPDDAMQNYHVEVSERCSAELDALDSFRKPNLIDMVRSCDNLHWRFDLSVRRKYSYIMAKKGDSLAGYAVISRQQQQGGVMAGLVIDCVIKDNDTGCFEALLSRAMQEFAHSACHIVATWAFSDSELRRIFMQKFGFRSSLKSPYSRFIAPGYMDLLLIDKNIADTLDVYDSTNWRVTYAYSNFA